MICKQTYSYTTPLPPSLTEIFFPSEETSPSPFTACVPFSVVSTLNSSRGGEIFGWRCLHAPGSCWCGETSRKPAGHQEHLPSVELLVSIPIHVEPIDKEVLFITQNSTKEAIFPMSKYFLPVIVFATVMISM